MIFRAPPLWYTWFLMRAVTRGTERTHYKKLIMLAGYGGRVPLRLEHQQGGEQWPTVKPKHGSSLSKP